MKFKNITYYLFLTFIMYNSSIIAQNDTIFYNQKWKETTKSQAAFYRPLPLSQKGENFLIKDYYINGGLQFEGWTNSSNLEDSYIGKVIWYYPNGNKKVEANYENSKVNGLEITYFENGKIKRERQISNNELEISKSYNQDGKLLNTLIHKDGYPHEGVTSCFVTYKNGKKVGKILYYENTTIPALINECSEEGCYNWNNETHYDINGAIVQENRTVENKLEEGRKISYYEAETCGYVKAVKSIKTYKNGRLNGPFIRYDLNGKEMYKGTYKDSQPQNGTFEERDLSLTFISEYKNGKKNGKEIVLNKEKQIAEGVYLNGERQTGSFVEDRDYHPIILNLVNGIEEGKQTYYNVARDISMGYYHSKNGKKDGDYAIFDYDGNLIVKATYKNGRPYEGTVLRNKETLYYKNGKRLRENTHIDTVEKKKMEIFSKGSETIEGTYNMGGFEMASSIVFLDTHQFFYSLSIGSLDLITYGAYHLKNGKIKLKIPEEQKQAFVIYGSKNPNIKDSIQIRYYYYNAGNKPLLQLNKQWYSMGDLKKQQGRERTQRGIDSFKIGINKLSSIKIGVQRERYNATDIILKSVLEIKNPNDFNDFIIAYNITNEEITKFEKTTFTIKGENLINNDKELKKRTINEKNKEIILDYIIENKSFPYYIRNNKFQKIKIKSNHSNQKINTYLQLNKSKE